MKNKKLNTDSVTPTTIMWLLLQLLYVVNAAKKVGIERETKIFIYFWSLWQKGSWLKTLIWIAWLTGLASEVKECQSIK